MSAKRNIAAAASPRKDHRGRPATPFLRERILRSATELFARSEFDLVLIDEVAGQAGVGKGSVYRQFGSKEELYAAVVISGFEQLQRQIRTALADIDSTRGQIATIVRHTLTFFWERRPFFALLRDPKALPRRQERQYRAQRNKLSGIVSGVLNDGIERGSIRSDIDTRLAAESLLGMLRGINRYSREYASPALAVETVMAIFFDGCAAQSQPDEKLRRG